MHKKQLSTIDIEMNIRGIQSKVIVDSKSITLKNLILNPNQSIPPHQVPVDVTFFIIEGTGHIQIGDMNYEVKKDDFIVCTPNTEMSIKASQEGLSFLNIKTPGLNLSK